MAGKRAWLTGSILAAIFCFVGGLLIGLFVLENPVRNHSSSSSSSVQMTPAPATAEAKENPFERFLQDGDPSITEKLIGEINTENIEKHLLFLSEQPHLAGTPGDQRTVEYVVEQFEAMGYDVTLSHYDVLLSYPAESHFNKVSMLDGRGRPLFTSKPGARTGSQWDKDVTWPYCFYSPSGKVKGKLLYANYGRPQDFRTLDKLGVYIQDAVVIIRYGKISRARKVREATKRGASAVILYNDPADVNINMTYNVFPATWWLPGDDVEHGNIRTSWGDPATPGYASTDDAIRIPLEEMDLPTIPCHPLGYDDARVLIQNLEGEAAPEDWQGELGFVYHIGTNKPGALPVEVDIQNKLQNRRVFNVFATLKGTVEPDRYVLVGNHRDAVAYGALDPGSGTAVMLEMARVFAKLAKDGWKPRRSIMFGSWAAEEFGLIGSTEWVEEKRKWLMDHAVAYLNLDTVLQGNYTFDMSATPSLKAAAIRAASKIPDAHQANQTVLDTWKARVADERSPDEPWIRRPVSFTDLHPFVHLAAIPVTHSRYSFVEINGVLIYPIRNYPLYHSVYDTMRLARMMDPGWAATRAVTALVGELARDLADSLLLPINVKDFVEDVVSHLNAGTLVDTSESYNLSIASLHAACEQFVVAAETLQDKVDSATVENPFEVRLLNDKLMQYEKEFLDPSDGTHLILAHGSNSNPKLDLQTISKLTMAIKAATTILDLKT